MSRTKELARRREVMPLIGREVSIFVRCMCGEAELSVTGTLLYSKTLDFYMVSLLPCRKPSRGPARVIFTDHEIDFVTLAAEPDTPVITLDMGS